MKTLSVVIPFYNSESTLEKAVMSCLDARVLDDIEVIMVNDGSKDNSLAVARKIERKYSQSVIVIDKPNGGKGSCMNVGIAKANGKYVRELDSDDYFVENSVYEMIMKIKSIDVDVIYTNYKEIFENTKKEKKYNCYFGTYDVILNMNETPIPLKKYKMHALTYKTSYIRKIQFVQSEGISYTDTEYVYYPMILAESFIALDITLYCYCLGMQDQSVSVKSLKKKFSNLWVLLYHFINDKNHLNGNRSTIDIRSNIIASLLYSVLLVYLIHSDYNIETEKEIRSVIKKIQKKEPELYKKMTKHLKNLKYVMFEWLVLGRIHFMIRKFVLPKSDRAS